MANEKRVDIIDSHYGQNGRRQRAAANDLQADGKTNHRRSVARHGYPQKCHAGIAEQAKLEGEPSLPRILKDNQQVIAFRVFKNVDNSS